MGNIIEILEPTGGIEGIFITPIMIYILVIIAVLIVTMRLARGGRRTFWRIVPVLVLVFLVPLVNTTNMESPGGLAERDGDSFVEEAKKLLISIADAQVTYFSAHNRWAGYQEDDDVFAKLGWGPGESAHYAYYCGNDYIIPAKGVAGFDYPKPATDWPFGFYPEITLSDFVCMAIGNNDEDSFPDVWMINKFKKPAHLLDDAANKVLVDIISKPFDPQHFYASKFYADAGRMASYVYIEINLPAYRLDLYADGRYLRSYPVGIGMLGFKTPLRSFYLERLEWNPWWIPPNAAWCREKKKKEEGKKDEEVANGKKKKDEGCKPVSPGPWNPLGLVKMILQSSYLIHGTNKPWSIGRRSSHGCIRMYSNDAADLAWKVMVLGGTKQPLANPELYRTKTRKTFRVSLLTPVQVVTVYKRMEVFDGALLLHPDIYGWRPLGPETIRKKLAEYGLSMNAISNGDGRARISSRPDKTLRFPLKFNAAGVNK